MKYFAIFLVLAGFSGIVLAQQVFAEDSLSFDFAHNLSEDDFDTGRFSYFQYGEKFYQYAYHPFGALSGGSASRCHFTSDFVLQESLLSESGHALYKFPNDMIWPGGYDNSTFYVVRSPSSNFPEDNNFEQLTPTKTNDSIILEFELVSGLNTFVANSTAFWDSQKSQIVDCPNPFDFEKQEYEYYDFVYPLKIQQNRAKMLGLTNGDFLCKPEFIQVLKNDGSPACVTLETKTKLFERGWIHHDESLSIKFAPLLLGHPKYTFDWCTTNNGIWIDVRDTCYLQSQKDLDQSSVDLQAYAKSAMESKENED